jgi:4-amino-4-deoxy-L-arabinose transferase-like glycosyltransferase
MHAPAILGHIPAATMATTALPKASVQANVSPAAILASPSCAVVVAFCLRLFLCLLSHRFEDTAHVDLQIIGKEAGFLAWSLASGKGFSHPFLGYDAITAWLAPVFPALWSIGFRIFPPNASLGGLYFCQLMNSAFSAFTCWPIYWLGKRLFNAKTGVAASWTWVFFPLAVLFPLEWAWDQNLSALLLALLLCVTYKMREVPPASAAWAGYGLLWGIATLLNPTLCVMLPFLLFWLVFCRWRSGVPAFRLLPKMVLFLLLPILPWTARNYFALHGFVPVKSNFGLELWLGNNAAVSDGVWSPQMHPMNNFRELVALNLSGEPGYMRDKQRAALTFIRANPRRFANLLGRRVADTWAALYDSREDKWMSVLHLHLAEIYFCVVFSAFAAAGLVLALRRSAVEALPVVLCVVVFPVPYYLTHTSLRYRHPIDPVLTLFAVYAVAQLMFTFHSKQFKPVPEKAATRRTNEPL